MTPIPEILAYLKTQRIGVLAVEMPDGSPHAATVHFAHTENPFVFYFETDPKTRKSEAFVNGSARASFVVGTNENDMKTLQMDGIAKVAAPEEKESFEKVYFGKFSDKAGKYGEQMLFTFTPTWWRFTDWKTSEGKKIWTS